MNAGPFDQSPARRGLDLLLATHPHLELVEADWQRPTETSAGGPWLLVTLGQRPTDGADVFALYPFAIWKATGAVHGIGDDAYLDLSAREERLREALSFYAQQRGLGSRLASDGGKIARNALSTPAVTDDPILEP